MSIGIYKYTNKLNGKIYIGQSSNIEKRYQQHLYDAKYPERSTGIDFAINKYGIENFTFEIVELCDIKRLDEREIYWISFYDSYHNGYNCTSGGKSLKEEEHPRAIMTKKQVWELREMYKNHIKRSDAFAHFSDCDISERGLLKIWNGETWPNVHMDVYTPENKAWHKSQVGHAEDQIGLSSFDRAMKQEEINLWVQDYNNGLTINAIAKKYHHDNSTIEKYIANPTAIQKVKYRGRKVQNIETQQCFSSISAAAKWAGCGATTLTRHLATDKVAGKIPNTNTPAHWIEIL